MQLYISDRVIFDLKPVRAASDIFIEFQNFFDLLNMLAREVVTNDAVSQRPQVVRAIFLDVYVDRKSFLSHFLNSFEIFNEEKPKGRRCAMHHLHNFLLIKAETHNFDKQVFAYDFAHLKFGSLLVTLLERAYSSKQIQLLSIRRCIDHFKICFCLVLIGFLFR